ncbi:uncharacterized protein LOC122080798 [Macadamia integrifolia]|uniref:uncharacterized protein LOC122080798 n=1 Tax=Macadamia integrifolia TaxID=60698 RepID=UPI001C4F47FC|nr:uncharacterized protein LOC122080798 [Macadamia integrifolia]
MAEIKEWNAMNCLAVHLPCSMKFVCACGGMERVALGLPCLGTVVLSAFCLVGRYLVHVLFDSRCSRMIFSCKVMQVERDLRVKLVERPQSEFDSERGLDLSLGFEIDTEQRKKNTKKKEMVRNEIEHDQFD